MKVFVSNKLGKLVQCLADQLNVPLKNPLAAETIVVQSTGMAKWVSLTLAHRHGIAANYRFPFPKKYIEEIFGAFIPGYSPDLSFDQQVLTWKILELLPQLSEDDEFLPLRHYLGDSSDQQKMYQLARKIASTFDQYLIFRPEMILGWEEGTVTDSREVWQAKLWRKIVAAQGALHQARLRNLFLSAVKTRPCRKEVLPERLSIFGISYLPPYYLEILSRLSAHLPVDYYYLNPSREFWADIRSRREIDATLSKVSTGLSEMDDDLLHLESGNSLLASWGRQGRDFFRLMENIPAEVVDLFEQPESNSLLTAIQSDVYLLQEPGTSDKPRTQWSSEDDSIQIHSCHSPLREVETLHDVLLKLFEKNGRLTPKDVLVMTPNIERYAPYIEAVFEAREPTIPYTIADRGQYSAGVISHGLIALLDLAASRFTAGDVLSILENAAISEKFEITSADLELIRHWVSETHIKWGIDAAHRQAYDLPPFSQNTWRQGLDRLLVGLTLDGRRRELFADILPYGEIESGETQVLGRFLAFWENVISLRESLLLPHPLTDWYVILQNILADFLPSAEAYRNDLYLLRQVISGLAAEGQSAKSSQLISLSIVKSYIREAVERPEGSSRFLTGGVSFCALLPMRSIPFDVICLMGMDNDAYPRQDRKIGFNVMETRRKVGDRSLRNDDQYLFLEAVLSAGQNLIISYVGQSATDNSQILPSVLVCEFLDYLDKNYPGENDQPLSKRITREHRLNAFSPAYFGDEKDLFSYSRQNYLAALAVLGRKKEKTKFMQEALPETSTSTEIITIKDLIAFYRNPARYFLENRLCLKLPTTLWKNEEESEPFNIDALSAYQIKQALVESQITTGDDQSLFQLKKAEGVLPVGSAGNYYYNMLNDEARSYARRVAPYLQAEQLEKRSIDLRIGDNRLTGTLDNLYDVYRVNYRMAKLKMNDYLSAWIFHLILNAEPVEGYPQTSLLLGEDYRWRFRPVPGAQEKLKILIKYYHLGRNKPLKLFTRSSWEYAQALWFKAKSPSEALSVACDVWRGDDDGRTDAEYQETACKICFENDMPIDEEFEQTTVDILKELFTYLEKLE
jgi:exodeoxyribonuclease V gamma subunit